MERGTDWERAAVNRQWRELERQRRAATRLAGGLALVLSGLLGTLLGLTTEACVRVGAVQQGCTPVVPQPTEFALLLVSPLAAVCGVWLCWTALQQ